MPAGAKDLFTVIANQCAHWCGNLYRILEIATVAALPRNDAEGTGGMPAGEKV